MTGELRRGRPRIILDAEKIERFMAKGFTQQWIADYFGVSEDTLTRNYSEALRRGRAFRDGCLQAKQYHTAMAKGNVTMQIWLGKQWLGQKEKTETFQPGSEWSIGSVPAEAQQKSADGEWRN